MDLDDLTSFDEKLRDLVLKQPADYLPLFEDGAKEVLILSGAFGFLKARLLVLLQ